MKPIENPRGELLSILLIAASRDALQKAVLSKPADEAVKKTVLTPRFISGQKMLQAECFLADNKAVHRNIAPDDRKALEGLLSAYGQINLLTTVGECEYRSSKSGKEVLLGGNLKRKLVEPQEPVETIRILGNDNEKSHILKGDEPFLKLLGVSDGNGRIFDRKRSKFNQINRFLEEIRDILPHLPKEGKLIVYDLCCGKSYLSFAAYHYFKNVLGREIEMTGIDLKPDVIEYCGDVARMLGFDTLSFLCGDIGECKPIGHPALVLSLHACDTATDIVLENAIRWKAEVILSTPCCHHELNHTIHCAPLSFVTEHSMLRQKLCDAATDALRLKLLEANGYAVEALELIDPEETPKNILLRAVKRPSDPAREEAARKEYEAARAFLLGL